MTDAYCIDWTNVEKYSELECECYCGAIFRSHAKFVMEPKPAQVSRKPCPGCGKHDRLRRTSSDPETFSIQSKKT